MLRYFLFLSTLVTQLADQIKDKGRHSTSDLPPLLEQAERLAADASQDVLTRGLAHRAAGNAHRLLNRFHSALDHYRDAASWLETIDQPTELARTLHASLVPLFFLGRFEELFASAERARALFESCGDHRGIARLNVNLAHAYHRLDRHQEALACSESAVSILEKIGDAEGFVAASINSAATLTIMHEFDRAEDRYQKAQQAAEKNNLWSSVLLCRHNVAYLRYFAGDTNAALREYADLHLEYRKLDDEWQICRCWLDEAEIFLEIGGLEEAISAARESCKLARKLGLNLEIGRSLLFEAAAQLRLEHADEAAALLQEAARRFEGESNNVWTAAAQLQAALLLEDDRATALPKAVAAREMLEKAGIPHRLAMADVVIGRIQRSLGETECAIHSFRSALDAARHSRSQWMVFHASYELGASLAVKRPEESALLFRQAEQMLDRLWDRLGSDDLKMAFLADRENVYTHMVRGALDSPSTGFELSEKARSRVLREQLIDRGFATSCAGIQTQLRPDESVIEYFIAGNDLYIFTVTDTSVNCFRRELIVDRMKRICQDLDRHMASCSVKWERLGAAQRHLRKTAQEHLRQLREILLDPVVDELRNKVIVAPHGCLHSVPFHAFAGAREVVYSPSAALYCAAPRETEYEKPLFVAFSRGSRSSEEEVEQAAQSFTGATVLINPSLSALREALSVARSLVHIAGHAGIDTVRGKLSWIDTPERRMTGRDLVDMHIRAKTIVVTGCHTARRVIRPGDEWLGLMRAFYASGASTIVSAFWEIRDEAARRFASEFYRLFDGNNASAAVQTASAALREWQAHPYFWAGFGAFARRT